MNKEEFKKFIRKVRKEVKIDRKSGITPYLCLAFHKTLDYQGDKVIEKFGQLFKPRKSQVTYDMESEGFWGKYSYEERETALDLFEQICLSEGYYKEF